MLLVATACTTSGQQPHPTPARPAATTLTSADPIAALRRPLRLPILKPGTPCPVAPAHRVDPAFAGVLGDGPVDPTDSARSWRDGRIDGGWYCAKVLWVADPSQPGPLLIRARQLDGPGQLRFGEGPQPDAELLLPAGGTARSPDSDWFNCPSYSRLRGGGCYAFQVDSASGSQVISFWA